jgi:hypothetical protein
MKFALESACEAIVEGSFELKDYTSQVAIPVDTVLNTMQNNSKFILEKMQV